PSLTGLVATVPVQHPEPRTMKFEIGQMTVGDILDRGLKILFARLGTFYVINLIVLTPLLLYQVVSPSLLQSAASQGGAAAAFPLMFGLLFVLVLTVVLAYIGEAACLHVIGQEFIGEKVTVGAALGFAMQRFGTLFGVSLLVGLLVGVGGCMCIVPGFLF